MRGYIWHLLFKKITEDAVNHDMSPFTIRLISSAIMFAMFSAGFFIGYFIWGRYFGYICAIAFAALGYYICHVIANHSYVNYTPRKKNMVQMESYVSKKYFMPWAHVERTYAQITVVTEIGGYSQPAVWEFFLNGRKTGEVKDGSPITFPTGHKSNVIVARNDKGALSPPFEFSVKSGRHLELSFSEGRFGRAKDIGRMAYKAGASFKSEACGAETSYLLGGSESEK